MRYGSVCSGIEAASCAWHPLGWEPLAVPVMAWIGRRIAFVERLLAGATP